MDIALPDRPLTGSHILLRTFRASDESALRSAADDELIQKYTFPRLDVTSGEKNVWVQTKLNAPADGTARLAIADLADTQLLGAISLHIEAPGVAQSGFWIVPEHRRHGYAADAVGLISEWAFASHSVLRMELFIDHNNLASQGVARSAHHVHEANVNYRISADVMRNVQVWSLERHAS
jgi:RimJ/RimL family protein N-acetyltransferase